MRSEVTLADAGYHSGSNLQECADTGRRIVMPEAQRRMLARPYHKDRFTYDERSDSYICPQGRQLRFTRIKHTRGTRMQLYRSSGAVCRACPAFGVCTKDARHGRAIEVGPHDAPLRRHRAWMSTEQARQLYTQRKQLVEPVFGIIKEQQGARRFLLRGIDNVTAEWNLLAIAFNLRALWRVMVWTGNTSMASQSRHIVGARGHYRRIRRFGLSDSVQSWHKYGREYALHFSYHHISSETGSLWLPVLGSGQLSSKNVPTARLHEGLL